MSKRNLARKLGRFRPQYPLVFICLIAFILLGSSSSQAKIPWQSSTNSVQPSETLFEPSDYNIISLENFETPEIWPDVALESETVHAGSYSGRWADHVDNPSVNMDIGPALKITDNHNFQFWLHSTTPNQAEINIVIEPSNVGSDLQNYYIYNLKVDWTGWRFFNLAIDDFAAKGAPSGWAGMRKIRFNTNGWGNTPHPETDVIFDDIQFTPKVVELASQTPQPARTSSDWIYTLRLQNNTGQRRAFTLAVAAHPTSALSATLLQNTVTIGNGQSSEVQIEAALLDAVDSGQALMPNRRIQVEVAIDDQTIDTLEILVFPALPSHPRLYLQGADVPKMQARYAHPDLAYTQSELQAQLAMHTSGISPSKRADKEIRRSIEARAFLHLINDDAAMGQQAVKMMLEFLDSITRQYDSIEDARDLYDTLVAAAMVYDWCYDLLSTDDQAAMIAGMKKVASLSEYGWPITDELQFLTGHYNEHSAVALLAAGIAIFDEDPEMFTAVYGHFIEGLVPSRNGFYPMGKHNQGTSYAVSRFFHEAHSALLFDAIDYQNIYSTDQAKVPYHMFYARTPSGKFLTEGDIADPTHIDPRNQFIMAQLANDLYLMNDGLRIARDGRYWSLGDATRTLLFWDPTIPSKAVDELSTARYFPSPSGSMVARTGWGLDDGTESGVAMALMNIGEYHFGNHDHLDSGHFGLYYKGTLALDSGIYEGSEGGYNSQHGQNYYRRTVAHNALLIEDPNEPLSQHYGSEVETRDGGQYRPNGGHEWDSYAEMVAAGKHAEVLAHEIGSGTAPEYTYLKGDLAAGYNAPASTNYPPKVDEVQRSFVFFDLKNDSHPASLIVFDRVTSTDTSFKKKWLLHSVEKPAVNGSRIDITRTDGDHNGRLINDVLLPPANNQQIQRVGGPGYEFHVDGKNYDNSPPRNEEVEPGAWRIELSPATDAPTDLFLNVMQVMDANGGPEPLAPTMLESAQMIGAKIADRAVFFSKSGTLLNGKLTLNIGQGTAPVKVLVTDLAPGNWTIQTPGKTLKATATGDGKSIYFSAVPGTYTLTKEPGEPLPTPLPEKTATPLPTPTSVQPLPTQLPTPLPIPTIIQPSPTARPTRQPNIEVTPLAETFDGISGVYDGIDGWQAFHSFIETNPAEGVDHALSLSGKNATAQKALPIGITQGSTGTLHFRIKRMGDADVFVGLSDQTAARDFASFEVQIGSQFGPYGDSEPDRFAVRSGDAPLNLEANFLRDEWYCLWLVVDNETNQYEAFAKGGELRQVTQLSLNGQSRFVFRNGTENRLQTFYARTGYESNKVYIDDIYMTPNQVNLSSPTLSCQENTSPQPTATITAIPSGSATPAGTPNPNVSPVSATPITPVATLRPGETPTPNPRGTPGGEPVPTSTAQSTPQPGTLLPPPVNTPETPQVATHSISGRVFIDRNNNGILDEAESAIKGVIVILKDLATAGQTVTTTALTDQDGIYRFSSLSGGDYILSIVLPSGYGMSGGAYRISTGQGETEVPSLGLVREVPEGGSIFLPFITQ